MNKDSETRQNTLFHFGHHIYLQSYFLHQIILPDQKWHALQRLKFKTLKGNASCSFRQSEAKTSILRAIASNLYHYSKGRRQDPSLKETERGRPSTLSLKNVKTMETILASEGFESWALTSMRRIRL